jgi:hypothetical protein
MKSKKPEEPKEDEAAIMERMDEALKRMMNTPHETHREMIERRRGETAPKRRSKTKRTK